MMDPMTQLLFIGYFAGLVMGLLAGQILGMLRTQKLINEIEEVTRGDTHAEDQKGTELPARDKGDELRGLPMVCPGASLPGHRRHRPGIAAAMHPDRPGTGPQLPDQSGACLQ